MRRIALFILFTSLMGCAIKGNVQQTTEFRTFIRGFFSSESYQIKHVRFPVAFVHFQTGEPDSALITTYVEKKDWEYFKGPDSYRCLSDCYDIIIYDNYQRKFRDNKKRVLSFEGVDNGINTALYFEFINNEWYLIKYEQLDT